MVGKKLGTVGQNNTITFFVIISHLGGFYNENWVKKEILVSYH